MIEVKLNDSAKKIPLNSSLEQVMDLFSISTKGIAVAVNSFVIPKDNWPKTIVELNDDILIIKATQGG